MVAHRENPAAPVDAATLLHVEGQRLRTLKHPLAARAGWAMLLAAAKLESWGDPACMVRYQKVSPLNNPWCEACKEPDCCVSSDGTCAMIRKYLSENDKEHPTT